MHAVWPDTTDAAVFNRPYMISTTAPLVPALGVMWQEVDKQTEKDEQDVTVDSPLGLLRKVFPTCCGKSG